MKIRFKFPKSLYCTGLMTLLVINFMLAQIPEEGVGLNADEILQEYIDSNKVAGISAGILIKDSVIWSGASGFADIKNKIAFTTETKTRIASIAKAMTAIAILQLYENGKLDLDDPVKKHLSCFPDKEEGIITIRHVLNHTSGIGAYEGIEFITTKNYKTLKDVMAIFQDRPLMNKPGEGYFYTSYGYVLLGAIIEEVTKLTFEEYMQQHVWIPAGMGNTGVEKYAEVYENKSKLYQRYDDGTVTTEMKNNLSNRVPGGGFYSTLEDMLRFGQAIINHKLVKASTLELMIQDPGIKVGRGSGYGFGWYLYGVNRRGDNVFGHSGSQPGTATQLFIWPAKSMVVVAVSNTSVYNDVFECADRLGGKAYEALGK